MYRRVLSAWLWVALAAAQPPPDALNRILARMRANLSRLPDYVCSQAVERTRRAGPAASFRPLDTLRLEVGVAGNRELYSWPGAAVFEETDLADMAGSGIIGTGHFALLAKHVFAAGVAEFTPRGEETLNGRRALRFDYAVSREVSGYKVRVRPLEAVVAFAGSFWADPGTMNVLRLEVRAVDIPEQLGMAEVNTAIEYAPVDIGGASFLLPAASELTMLSTSGEESRNVARFTACRKYQTESVLSFETRPPAEGQASRAGDLRLPAQLTLEVELASDIDLRRAAVGDEIRGVLTRALRDADGVLAPEGAAVTGRLINVERQELPVPHYVVGLQFHTLEMAGARGHLVARLEHAGSAPGLMRQARRMNPTFTRTRAPRIEVLADGQQPGRGVLHWDAAHPRIPRGMHMRWRTM